MSKRVSKRLVYVMSSNSSNVGHSLGVNSLAIDPTPQENSSTSGLLYSAGRDGLVNCWSLDNMNLDNSKDLTSLSDYVGPAKALVNDSSKPNVVKKPDYGKTENVKKAQLHTNWINDIVLVNDYKSVASCSSDLTVKLWTPHTDEQTVIGQHLDYVKCLASVSPTTDWIVSGGLDRHINGWDVAENRGQIFSIDVGDNGKNPKGSIYALAVNKNAQGASSSPSHSLIAAGGPECLIKLWDTRDTKKTIASFIGHTDNIRSILVSQGGDWVLSASSDSTIKLWSMTASRLYHTFDMHDAPVWSLFSHHPNLDVFYSSDKSGVIAKTDLRGCTLNRDVDDAVCAILCNEHEGVSKFVTAGDYVWTGTANSRIHRWQNLDTTPFACDISSTKTPSPTDNGNGATVAHVNKLSALLPPKDSSPAINLTAASAPGTAPSSPVLQAKTASAAVNDVSKRFICTPFIRLGGEPALELIPPSEYEGKDGDITVSVSPKYENPVETLQGSIGLIKHRLLTNRRHVLTLDTSGDIKMWDLLRGVPIRSFDRAMYDLDDLAEQLSSFETVPNWCSVAIRAGELYVSLDTASCFDSEIYVDTLEEDLLSSLNTKEFPPDHRINLGKWVIRNLLAKFLEAEIEKENKRREELGKPLESESSDNTTNGGSVTNPFDDQEAAIDTVKVVIPPPAPVAPEPEKKESGSKFRLRFSKSKKDKDSKEAKNNKNAPEPPAPPPPKPVEPPQACSIKEMLKKLRLKSDPIVFSLPGAIEAPVINFPDYTKIMISEQSPNSGDTVDLYRGTVGGAGKDVSILEEVAPDWIGRALLLNEVTRKDLAKVGFIIQPFQEDTLPAMINSNVRLSAYHIIRARKVLAYLEERLNGATIPQDLDVQKRQVPENWLEFFCQGQKVPPSMTLATIRTRLWRSGGDVVLKYQMKV